MNRFHLSHALAIVPAFLFSVLVGCSSGDATNDGGSDAQGDTSMPADSGNPMDSTVQDTGTPDSGSDTGAPTDGASTDGNAEAEADGGADSGLPAPGSPCNTPNAVQNQTCGLCGNQLRACLPNGDGGYIWGSWGFCQGEVVNGCDPNKQYPDNDCGLCGKRKSVCLQNCTYDLTQQCVEPMSACIPGDKDFAIGLSCDAGGRERQCDNSCQFGGWSLNCYTEGTGLEVPNAVNGTITDRIQMLPQIKKVGTAGSLTCPLSITYPTSSLVAFTYTKLVNNTGKTAVVSIWHSRLLGAGTEDTIMAVYKGNTPPADNDDAARRLCTGSVVDGCLTKVTIKLSNYDSSSCEGSGVFAGLMAAESKGITLAPGETAWIYSSPYSKNVTTEVLLTIRTESLN